jgi:hypothetical protein
MSTAVILTAIYSVSFAAIVAMAVHKFVETRRTKVTHFLVSARMEKATRGDLVSMSLSSLLWAIIPGLNTSLAGANMIVYIIAAIHNRKKGKIYNWWTTPL